MKESTVRSANRTKHITATVLTIAFSVYAQTTSPPKADQVPQGTSDLVRQAQVLYRLRRFDEAAQKYLRLLGEQPKAADAYAGLTRVYLKEKKVQQARETISKGLEIVDSASMRVALGEVLFREGKIAEAESEWLRVLDSGHADARAHMGLARVSLASTQYRQAKTEIDKAHTLDPGDPDIEFYWLQFLKSSEQVPYLEKYLSDANGATAEERAHLRSYLEFLRADMGSSTHVCRLASDLAPAETDLLIVAGERQGQIRGYSLAVSLNGQNSKLQLDTGASGILIDRRIAQKAGLSKISDTTLGGFGDQGESSGYFAMASSIKIGTLEFRDCPVVVLDKRSVLGEDGLIGTDVFQEFLIDLDFRNRKLRLGTLPSRPDEIPGQISLQTAVPNQDVPPSDSSNSSAKPADTGSQTYVNLSKRFYPPQFSFAFTPVFRFGHALLIPTEVGDIQGTKLFEIDTGACNNVVGVNVAREIAKVQLNSRMTIQGLSGSVRNVYGIDKTALYFDHVQQYAENQIAVDLQHLSDATGTEISGFLGVNTFNGHDIIIDYRDGLVAFDHQR